MRQVTLGDFTFLIPHTAQPGPGTGFNLPCRPGTGLNLNQARGSKLNRDGAQPEAVTELENWTSDGFQPGLKDCVQALSF